MTSTTDLRRNFLRFTAAGLGGAALSSQTGLSFAQQAGKPLFTAPFDVRTFGATGDGKTLDTAAINKAIEAAAAAGGGTVYFPAGSYLSHSIHLKSNVNLHLEQGAVIVAADPLPPGAPGGYDPPEPNQWDMYQDFGHSHFCNSLIWGENLENIAITGLGRIWGKGLSKGYGPGPNAHTPGVANKSISLKNCHNVILRDFSILHGGHFGILATGVENLTIDNLKIDTNRDGMDIVSCRNVRITNCYVNSPWDDAICLKSDYALGRPKAAEFITISDCYVSGCWEEGSLLDGTYKRFAPDARIPHTGRIKFGTESNGGFRNITISNCVFEGCQGLALETVDGALLEDVTITNISMRDIITAPIFLRLGARMRGPEDLPVGTLRRVIISNLVCSNCSSRLGSIISGIPGHLIENVKISNVFISHQGGGSKEDAAYRPPEYEDMYPEPTMFVGGPRPNGRGPDGRWYPEGALPRAAAAGSPAPRAAASGGQAPAGGRNPMQGGAGVPVNRRSMPSHGFYVRHVRGIQFDNIEIRAEKEDLRPAFVLDDVQDAEFFRVRTSQAAGTPVFAMHSVSGVSIHRCPGVPDTELEQAEVKQL